MKALVFKGPWELEVQERDVREPRPGEAMVSVLATGVCGSDIHGFTGHTGRRHPNQVMGHETVGLLHALGSPSDVLREGDLVTINPGMACGECDACAAGEEQQCAGLRVLGVVPDVDAAFADFVTAPVRNLVPLGPSTPAALGALVEPMAVGYHAVRRSNLRPGESLLVIGGGPIGQAVALAASRFDAGSVLVTEPSPHRRGLLAKLGVRCVAPEALEDGLSEVKPSVVIDAVGNSGTIEHALTGSVKNARIVLLGMDEPQLRVPAYSVSVAERSIIGSFCYSRLDFESTARWIGENVALVTPLIDAIEPLTAGPEIFTKLARRELDASKVLLAPNPDGITALRMSEASTSGN
jgi:threonine dehydrogenase-like Zn-dependent dehydrogenase